MSRKFFFQCFIAASLTTAACGEEDDGGEMTGTDAGVTDAATSDAGQGASCDGLTYDGFAKPLLTKSCTACHGAVPAGNMVRLDTVENVRTQKVHIIEHAIEPRTEPKMPQGLPPLAVEDQAKLKKWLDCGAP